MSSSHSDPLPEGNGLASVGFNSQGPMGLAEILQMCCSGHRSGQITFRAGELSGYVYLQHGRVLHAVCAGVEGEDAVYRMLGWPEGTFALDEGILPHRKTVKLTWEQLLFEGARRADSISQTASSAPVSATVTAEPVTSSRTGDSMPKLTVVLPDQRPLIHELEAEYTHVGRAPGNEIPLSYPSVSNRHCMFIRSGRDIVLRDLNSSNGTVVNGETISEVILRPGDLIQVGVVQIKFEPGVRRPKLTQTLPTEMKEESGLREIFSRGAPPRTTVKLPTGARPAASPPVEPADDSAFVKGEASISYENLPKPEIPGRTRPVMLIVTGLILVLALVAAGGYYYFFILRH
jgi:pSer/pThr/pTyr-binding forkhead associated (FHA) protein